MVSRPVTVVDFDKNNTTPAKAIGGTLARAAAWRGPRFLRSFCCNITLGHAREIVSEDFGNNGTSSARPT